MEITYRDVEISGKDEYEQEQRKSRLDDPRGRKGEIAMRCAFSEQENIRFRCKLYKLEG